MMMLQKSGYGLPDAVVRNRLILAASLLALVIAAKLWFAQGIFRPVRIAGASMAETLQGAHCQLNCGDCGFPCRYDADVRRRTSGWLSQLRLPEPRSAHGRVPAGARVLIDRLAYRCHPPRRWDLIAFRSHDAPDYLEVKRVVGLPGERISIRQGDVYADGRLARKTLPQLRPPPCWCMTAVSSPPHQWPAASLASAGRQRLDADCRRLSCPSTLERRTAADWLSYHHWRASPRRCRAATNTPSWTTTATIKTSRGSCIASGT